MRTLIVLLLLCRLLQCGAAHAFDPAPVPGRQGMVVSAQHLATEVGVEVLRRGGNAVDAAVAVGYALAVVYPAAGNLGGGGFMTVRMADGTEGFLDFREKAPGGATAGMFLDAAGEVVRGRSTDSWLAVGVPGTAAGLEAARVRWGRMERAALIGPAIRLAREGFVIEAGDAGLMRVAAGRLARDPAAAAIFLAEGHALGVGDRLVQADLAGTLSVLAAEGPDALYRGPVGEAIVAASAAGGGLLKKADFEGYRVRAMEPVRCRYRGYDVVSAPPPSSGGVVLCEILNILEGYDLHAMGFHSAAEVHVLAEAMRHAFYDRNNRLGDPDFVANPLGELLDKAYAARIRAAIRAERATLSGEVREAPAGEVREAPAGEVREVPGEGTNTTHYAVVDGAGNAVSVTYTLNDWFGAGRVAAGTGIVMNNEMDDFSAKPGAANMFGLVQGTANAVAPGKTPLSSMAPTILVREGRVAMVIGSPGGPRIITTVLEAILNVVDHGMTVQEAVDAPRLHHQWLPDTLFVERFALSPDTQRVLEGRGYRIMEQAPWGIAEGIVVGGPRLGPAPAGGSAQSLVLVGPDAGGATLFGAHDPRGGAGSAEGY